MDCGIQNVFFPIGGCANQSVVVLGEGREGEYSVDVCEDAGAACLFRI